MNTKTLSVILCSALLTACSGNKDAHDASGIFETTETIVSARTSGLLTAFDVKEGKDLQSGAKVGCVDTALLSLRRSELKASAGSAAGSVLDISRQSADLRQMKLRAYVTAEQFANLKIGQKVRVVSDCGGEAERQYEGRVEWISDKAEFTPKTIQTKDERANLVYAVKIAVANDGFIKRGMYGDVDF